MPGTQLGSRTDGGRSADHCSLPNEIMWRSVWCGTLCHNELREVAWLASMVGALSILSVVVGAGLALMFVGVA